MRTSLVVLACALLVAPACKKGEEAQPTPAAPIASSSAATTATTVDYTIDPKGQASIDMPAPKERIKGETDGAKGVFHVDLANLASTRGDVFIDLQTLTTHTFGDAEKDHTQTHHAHTWLQVDDTVKDPNVRERFRWAHFAIRSIDHLSATDASKIAPTHEGGEDVRTVTLTAHGDFEVHGQPSKGEKEAQLEVRLHYPPGAPPDSKPILIDVKSKSPLVVTLADHDVKPRDAEGQIAQKAFDLLGTKVADVANVSIDLHARPAS